MSAVSTKPYLLRALYEWCVDQGFTPYISVRVDAQTLVPRQFVLDGQIVLNLGTQAVQNLHLGNELISFQARFAGVAQAVSVPVDNVVAIYARENGQGMVFENEAESESEALSALDGQDAPTTEPPPAPPSPRSHLTRIK